MHHLRGSQTCRLSRIIISRTHLHHIGPYNLHSLQPIKYTQQLPTRPAPRLRSPRSRGEGRIKDVDINGDVDLVVTHSGFQFVDDAVDADTVDIPGFDDRKAAACVVVQVVVLVSDWGADARVDGGIADESFFVGEVEEGAVVDTAGEG